MKRAVESINDKNLFKAVFMAGGQGSGKSFVAKNMFGFDNFNISFSGAMLVNSDLLFETGLEKANLPMIINMSNASIYAQQMAIRNRAKQLTKTKQSMWINSMLPIVVDGTGKDFDKITRQAEALKAIGYDVAMVFVNTSLETALQRNAMRDRSVDPNLVKKMWSEVQNNLGRFQSYFTPKNFIVIDCNNSFERGSKEEMNFKDNLYKVGTKLLEAPLENPIGINNIAYLRAHDGKYLSDLPESELEESRKNENFGKDYSGILMVDQLDYVNNMPGLLPGISDIRKFVAALNNTGLNRFKMRSTHCPVSDTDLKDEWMALRKYGWSAYQDWDSSLNGFNEVIIFTKTNTKESSNAFNYMMLDRLRSDCEYSLTSGNLNLWGKTIDAHIAEMRKLMCEVPKAPDWLSTAQIDEYEKALKAKFPRG